MMLRRSGDNMGLVEHFLSHGSLQDVSEGTLTVMVTSHGISKVPRYQENRAATKSKLSLVFIHNKWCLHFLNLLFRMLFYHL